MQTIYMEKPLDAAWMGLQVELGRILGNHLGKVIVLTRLMDLQVGWGEGLNKRSITSISTSVWGKSAPPALILQPDN